MGDLFHEIYVVDLYKILIIIPIMLLVWSFLGAGINKWMRYVGVILAVISVGSILYRTVFSRSEFCAEADFIPFSSFVRARDNPEMYRSMLMNVFLFMPLGLSLPFVFGGGTAQRVLLTVLIGLLLSVTVEAIQYFGKLGMAETDDVICNTLGAIVGGCAYPLSLLWRKLINKARRKG